MTLKSRTLPLTQADIAVLESAGTGMPVLMLHGNSSFKEVFQAQLISPLAETYHMIAMDLPGHGQSSDARDDAVYSIPGYAHIVSEVLDALDLPQALILGWSLGGHIALELMWRDTRIKGAMIVGTPPFANGPMGMLRAFQMSWGLLLATKGRMRERDAAQFARLCLGDGADAQARAMIERTDPRARSRMGRSMVYGEASDQKMIVERAPVPIAIVNGEHEPFARLDYLERLDYANLWRGRCHVIAGAGHAPFRDDPGAFNALFGRFLQEAQTCAPPCNAGQERRVASA